MAELAVSCPVEGVVSGSLVVLAWRRAAEKRPRSLGHASPPSAQFHANHASREKKKRSDRKFERAAGGLTAAPLPAN